MIAIDIDRRRLAISFSRVMSKLVNARAYLVLGTGEVTYRKIGARKVHQLPAGAVLIGTYQYPFTMQDFIGDLDDVLEKLQPTVATRAAAAERARIDAAARFLLDGRVRA